MQMLRKMAANKPIALQCEGLPANHVMRYQAAIHQVPCTGSSIFQESAQPHPMLNLILWLGRYAQIRVGFRDVSFGSQRVTTPKRGKRYQCLQALMHRVEPGERGLKLLAWLGGYVSRKALNPPA
jgi:hypothetical protein